MNTLKNKPCKLCKKKGDICHIHASGTPGDVHASSSHSASRAEPTKKDLAYFSHLPFPALEQILLNIEDRNLLKMICSKSPNAMKICTEYNFQQKYLAKHSRRQYFDRNENFNFVNYADGFYFKTGPISVLITNNTRDGHFSANWKNDGDDLSEWFYSDASLDRRPSDQQSRMTDLYYYLMTKNNPEINEYMKTKNWKAIIG